MFNQEKINVFKQEFLDKANGLKVLLEYGKKMDENFLNVKLAFTALLGVIFAIVIDKIEIFGQKILLAFIIVIIFTFIFLLRDIWKNIKDSEEALKKQYKRTILAKIRHIAAMEEDIVGMKKYGEDAEKLLFENENTRQQMFNKLPIGEIIKYPENDWEWKIDFILWAIIFLSIPVLFLFKILNVL